MTTLPLCVYICPEEGLCNSLSLWPSLLFYIHKLRWHFQFLRAAVYDCASTLGQLLFHRTRFPAEQRGAGTFARWARATLLFVLDSINKAWVAGRPLTRLLARTLAADSALQWDMTSAPRSGPIRRQEVVFVTRRPLGARRRFVNRLWGGSGAR